MSDHHIVLIIKHYYDNNNYLIDTDMMITHDK